MRSSELDYDLPPELIAQRPSDRRDASRLLVYDRASGAIEHRRFHELPEIAGKALVVVNDTRVIPARLRRTRASGGAVEGLLLEPEPDGTWLFFSLSPPPRPPGARRALAPAGRGGAAGRRRARRDARRGALARSPRRRARGRGAAAALRHRA